jgi:hypothetical protein
MFYDDLSQHGEWAEYENYGPVWLPSQVEEDWRPYTDGRWAPTDNGYVFETQEPWGWATYHYGNWMPTEGYGWVWVPGRTWYPSTVEWRTSPENTPPDSSYIGWAPIPPPNYVPPPAYAQPSYYPGNPIGDALTAPFWIFARAASFLLGLGQPFAPTYSYVNSGVLVPPTYVQVFYPQTVFVRSYYTPAYYPRAYFGGHRPAFAAYNWGPPVHYVSRVTNINQTIINRTINYNSVNITRIHNVVAPAAVFNRHRYIRQIVPPALAQGRPLPRPNRVENYRMAQANLYKPNVLPPLRQVPPMRAQLPKLQRIGVTPSQGIPGTALPPRATMLLTPQMEQQIQSLPQNRRFIPAGVRSTPSAAATGPTQRQPLEPNKPDSRIQTQPRPGIQTQPRREEFRSAPTGPGPPPAGTLTPPGASQPRAVPPPQGTRASAPEQRRLQELEQQRMQRRALPRQPQQTPQQLQQEHLRQQQIQQQRRLQQGQQERVPQQQQEGFRSQQQQQQIRQQQMQQERLRQQQIQQQQRPQPQFRPKPQPQPQPQVMPRVQSQPQPRPQSRVMPQVQSRPQPRPQPQVMPRVQPQAQPRPQPQQQRQERGQRGQKNQPHY